MRKGKTLTKGLKPSSKRRYIALGGAVFAVMALWSAGWFYLKDRLQTEISFRRSALLEKGIQASCRDQTIAGFPFRYEVSCAPLLIDTASGLSLSLPALRTVALIYNPWHVILEAEGPGHFSSRPLELEANAAWTSGRSSVRYSTSALKAVDLVFDQPSWSAGGGGFVAQASADHLEFHLREVPDGSGDAEAFLSIGRATSPLAPQWPIPVDLRVHAAVPGGAALLSGHPLPPIGPEWRLPLKLHQLQLVTGSLEVLAAGDVSLDADGVLSGSLQLELTDLDGLASLLTAVMPDGSPLPVTLKGAATAFGTTQVKDDGRQVTVLPLTVTKGRVRVGLVPLGHLPPLRPLGSGS